MVLLTEVIVFYGVQTVCLNNCPKAFVMPRISVPWFWKLVTGLSPWRPRSDLGLVHVRHVVDKDVMGQVSLSILPLSHLSIIPPVLLTHHHFNITEKRTSV
jgi:hypothetical protein